MAVHGREPNAASDELDIGDSPDTLKQKAAESNFKNLSFDIFFDFYSIILDEHGSVLAGESKCLILDVMSSIIGNFKDVELLAVEGHLDHQKVAKRPCTNGQVPNLV